MSSFWKGAISVAGGMVLAALIDALYRGDQCALCLWNEPATKAGPQVCFSMAPLLDLWCS